MGLRKTPFVLAERHERLVRGAVKRVISDGRKWLCLTIRVESNPQNVPLPIRRISWWSVTRRAKDRQTAQRGNLGKATADLPLVAIEDNRLGGVSCTILHPRGWRLMKIPDEVRKCVAYLYYKTKKNLEPSGTVFFVACEGEVSREGGSQYLRYWTYAVTSRHVVEKIKAKGIDHKTHFALNNKDGRIEWLEAPISEWQFPSGPRSDVAILNIELDPANYDHLCFPHRGFMPHDELNEWGIGPGDEIYFSGLFTKRPGEPMNIPIIRVGTIAALPAGVIKTKFSDINAYLVEARSFGGLSGSPVFYSYRGIGSGGGMQRRDYEPPDAAEGGLFLLGYVQGHYDENEAADRFNMGIALVVPVSNISEALEHPPFVETRKRELEEARQEHANKNMPTDD